jgi:PIN domain nuclease of toxin-antitoxin system
VSNVGVLDAGVVLTRLDPARRGAREVDRLFRLPERAPGSLLLSTVNLAEVLEHTADYTKSTGIDLPALLEAMGVRFHSPDAAAARAVARLSRLRGLSLADRFAVATAELHSARLHTSDRELAAAVRRASLRVPVTLY